MNQTSTQQIASLRAKLQNVHGSILRIEMGNDFAYTTAAVELRRLRAHAKKLVDAIDYLKGESDRHGKREQSSHAEQAEPRGQGTA